MEIFEKIAGIVKRYEEINEALAEPDILNDMERYRQLLKERSQMEVIVGTYHQYRELETELDDLEIMLQDEDAELREMSRQEMFVIKEKQHDLEAEMKELLLPADPNDRKDAILEIRAGTGGDEASLFAGDLLRMYLRHAERRGWRVETISVNDTEMGGIKEIILSVSGRGGVYGRLRFESGVHRVQRVPVTETQGRIQTSAATVAVLPDVEDVQIEIKETDLRVDTYRSSGAGGQHVNKTESAIRITHIPTGIVVQCQDERSQFKNRDKAMRVLKSRLYDFYAKQQEASLESQRRSMVGSGDRSERIRTYNFPQGRVTDHRIGLTLHKIDQIMDGDLDELIDALVIADRAERLGSIEGE